MVKLPGTFYKRNDRWYWKVKLPGETKPKIMRLCPLGSRFATKDKNVAHECAKIIWQKAIFDSEKSADNPNTISDLVQKYMSYARNFYKKPSREAQNILYALQPLIDYFGDMNIEDFGPLKLKELQNIMIALNWCRGVVNQRIGIVKRAFKYGCSEQIVPVHIYQSLLTVEGLRHGRSEARETKAVMAIAERHIIAILPFVTKTIGAMLQLQLLTGMRSSEVCQMRSGDIEITGRVWFYRPGSHKTAYRGLNRIIAIGPKAQEIIYPFLKRDTTDYLFTPAEADLQRGQKARKTASEHYNKDTYRQAINYAIKAANKAGINVPFFSPHAIRHTAATKIRKDFGIEAAKVVLGHRHVKTSEIYAEQNFQEAIIIAEKIG